MTIRPSPFITVLLVCLYLMTWGVFALDNIQDATVWVNIGKEAYQKKDFASAIVAYDEALLRDEFYTEGWKLRGDALMELGKYEEAALSYERAITIDKNNPELLGRKGRALYLLGEYQEALALFTRAVSLNPNIFTNQDGYGDVLSALNRLTEADIAYTTALKIEPKNNETWNKKGEVLSRMFRNDEAVAAFNQSILLYPDSAEVWNNLGSVYFSMGQMQSALTAFEKAISLDENYIPKKYEDTLSLIAKDKSRISEPLPDAFSSIDEVSPFEIELPPGIFVLNYVMIITGVCAIFAIGIVQLMRKRRR